ncbi:MAG: esterase [Bacteroidetes bacterium]|nr:esterase [Bacteroidota bacterium]
MKLFSNHSFILPFLCIVLFAGCARQPISRTKNIVYSPAQQLSLNVFAPKNKKQPKEVLLFIHGGSWVHGKKSTYNFFGRGMAHKGVVTVIMDYRLSPLTGYDGMAIDAATAVEWLKAHIAEYGGDPNRIFISGHSAGGQIAALVATDNTYFDSLKVKDPLKGVILIDAFGLNMYRYFNEASYKPVVYYSVFTKDTAIWKKGSPIYHLNDHMPPFLMFLGGKTNPAIITGNNEFYASLKKYEPSTQLITVPHTRHVGMIFSFLNPRKKAYGQIIDFMKYR